MPGGVTADYLEHSKYYVKLLNNPTFQVHEVPGGVTADYLEHFTTT